MKGIKHQRLGIFAPRSSERVQFLKLVKAMDPNEVTAGYLEAIEKDAKRLRPIEVRLSRIEKTLVLLVKAVETIAKAVETIAKAEKERES